MFTVYTLIILCKYVCLYVVFFLFLTYLVASHAVAVEDANFLILLAGHVVQALVGLHITDLGRIHTESDIVTSTEKHTL